MRFVAAHVVFMHNLVREIQKQTEEATLSYSEFLKLKTNDCQLGFESGIILFFGWNQCVARGFFFFLLFGEQLKNADKLIFFYKSC